MLRYPFSYIKYYFRNDLNSERMLEINKNSQIDFFQTYYGLFDLKVLSFQRWMGPKIAVNKSFKIQPNPLFVFSKTHNKMVEIPVPSPSDDRKAILCRLMSATRRKGMVSRITFDSISYVDFGI